jgi:hypothetical protein
MWLSLTGIAALAGRMTERVRTQIAAEGEYLMFRTVTGRIARLCEASCRLSHGVLILLMFVVSFACWAVRSGCGTEWAWTCVVGVQNQGSPVGFPSPRGVKSGIRTLAGRALRENGGVEVPKITKRSPSNIELTLTQLTDLVQVPTKCYALEI